MAWRSVRGNVAGCEVRGWVGSAHSLVSGLWCSAPSVAVAVRGVVVVGAVGGEQPRGLSPKPPPRSARCGWEVRFAQLLQVGSYGPYPS